MDQQRPNFISLPPRSNTGLSSAHTSPSLSSPRREHVAGDVAPAMSPLDSLAAQSRALARQLDDSRRVDRRISRLPPLTVADSLVKRNGAWTLRSPNANAASSSSTPTTSAGGLPVGREDRFSPLTEESGIKLAIESPTTRPMSVHPRYGNMTPQTEFSRPEMPADERFLTPQEHPSTAADYFGVPRTSSPERTAPARPSLDSSSQKSSHSVSKASTEMHRNVDLVRGLSIESNSSRFSQYSNQLQPPNPPYARKTPSIRSVSSDDENPGITPSSSYSQRRKLSSSSGTSLPLSPQLQYKHLHNRSTSQLSETSMSGTRHNKPAYNFSRPMSRQSGRPSTESPSRKSIDSPTRIYSDDEVRPSMETTLSAEQEGETDEHGNSYIYAKFALPRGRPVDRDSLPLDGLMSQISMDQPASHPPDQTPSQSQSPNHLQPPRAPFHSTSASDATGRASTESLPMRPSPVVDLAQQHRHSMTSMNTSNTSNSASTIKASKHAHTPSQSDMTAEAHLEKGIACHESGSLNESTYHLRLAAKQNNPTAMLLYALACRHGWGMRQNPSEGAAWLRKAIDSANVEMNESINTASAPSATRRNKRAQFALGVYELGVSHMNGWGVDNDKALGLRCFEIAAAWGDADAMAEAGFCYSQGQGCKKDLKKAAAYYRKAEDKGISMVGNSWIHKSKYDTKPDDQDRASRSETAAGGADKKKRDKSRTRTLFSRRKTEK